MTIKSAAARIKQQLSIRLRMILVALAALTGCEAVDLHYARIAMFQSLEHNAVVVVDRLQAKDSGRVTAIRIGLAHDYDDRSTEIIRVPIRRGDGEINSNNVVASWSSADTLRLCVVNVSEPQVFDINVALGSHDLVGSTCSL